jgi:CHAD domain-containing protein
MQRYAREQTAALLLRVTFRMNRASKVRDADSIHDLRVAIRRFKQSLDIFHQFLSSGHKKKIRRQLRKIMELSGEVRNRDIALDLLKEAGWPTRSPLSARLLRERKGIHGELLALFDQWGDRDLSRKWVSRLGL